MSDLDIINHSDGSTVIAINGRSLYLPKAATDELIERLAKPTIIQEVSRILGVEY
ncbi:hypothetical protein LT337_07255 [Mycolicibacterium fortuitum]|nr:hypothetical protein LT337_07255 [Mycolicibacterium fortuitum]